MINEKDKTITIRWHISDVRNVLADYFAGVTLTDDECFEVLKSVEKHHDAETGVNWDNIEFHIEHFLQNKGA
ncbi:hypothetical protein KAR91_63105 [Candidatus Pacearchaeota archaeon]|nr:hypothetical protein [Candidatus Pacearchaeota archaeon]